jgi:hypothetical protein
VKKAFRSNSTTRSVFGRPAGMPLKITLALSDQCVSLRRSLAANERDDVAVCVSTLVPSGSI